VGSSFQHVEFSQSPPPPASRLSKRLVPFTIGPYAIRLFLSSNLRQRCFDWPSPAARKNNFSRRDIKIKFVPAKRNIMTRKWKTVHVFVSSTFNDMHAERDYLVKRVYPELRDWCERRQLELIDVDLRWGVTEQEAAENGDTVRRCLESIDQCRPYFICFLGQRYGWTPTKDQVSRSTVESYPRLASVLEKQACSMTELEILHATSTPFDAGDQPQPANHQAFFYVRDRTFLDSLPDRPVQLREIYIDQQQSQREALQRLIGSLRTLDRPVRPYSATWRTGPGDVTVELAMPLSPPSRPEAVARWRMDWEHYAGIRIQGDHILEGSEEAAQAGAYNRTLTKGRLANFQCLQEGGHATPLSEIVLSDLKSAFLAEYPDRNEVIINDELQTELDQHEQIRFHLCKEFIERADDFSILDAYVRDRGSDCVIAITGVSGSGKSTPVTLIHGGTRCAHDIVVFAICQLVGLGRCPIRIHDSHRREQRVCDHSHSGPV
jgi:Domain of unknown function (DUF4062)